MSYLQLLIGYLCVFAVGQVLGDPCVDHKNLTNWWRSTAYENDDWEHEDICDKDLEEGWYRAVSGAGGDMPTTPPGFNKCGTVYPIWLDGNLPIGEGEIECARACVTGVFSDCDSHLDIIVMNCGGYNVYHLKPTNACPEAYCFGSERKCPPGWDSPTGFTPGCTGTDPPVLTETPTLDYEVREIEAETGVRIKVIYFKCSIETPDIDQDLWFDVTYYIHNIKVYEILDIPEADLPGELPESEFATFQDPVTHQPNLGYGNNLTCTIGAKWNVGNDTGRPVDVSKHYGFEILSELPIRLREGDYPSEIRIRSRLPIDCHSLDPDCRILLDLHVPKYQEDFNTCEVESDGSHLVLGHTSCTLQLTEQNWDQGGTIGVKAIVSGIIGKEPRSIVARFYSESAAWKRSLSQLALPPVPVTIYETDYVSDLYCKVQSDPHMTLYNGNIWDMHYSGIYILYRNIRMDTEVQIATEQCSEHSTCVCAVMIRSGRSVFVFDTCGERNQNGERVGSGEPPRAKMYDCHDGRNEMLIQNTTMLNYKFTLSTKTVVEVNFQFYNENWHDVYITPSVEDYMNADGLCGFINDGGDVVKRLRNGNVASDDTAFANDWKATSDEILFPGKILKPQSPVMYCGCAEADGEVVCEDTLEHEDCIDKIFSDREYDTCRVSEQRRRLKSLTGKAPRNFGIVDDDDDVIIDWLDQEFVPDKNPVWKNGWTEEKAIEHCEKYILGKPSVQACLDVPGVDIEGPLKLCVHDILISGDTDASKTHVQGIKGQCMSIASRNLSHWKPSAKSDGKLVPPAHIINAGCIHECYDRGTCMNGKCICDEGFSGADCSVNHTAVPAIYKLPYHGVCNLQDWSCEATLVYGRQLFDSANLTCRIQHSQVTERGLVTTGTTETRSYMHRPGAAVCALDEYNWITNHLTQNDEVFGFAYEIQVSNDGQNFGNKLAMLTYDAKCAICANKDYSEIGCVAKERICKIEGQCYDDGEAKGSGEECLSCRYDTIVNDWVQESGTCYIGTRCFSENDENPNNPCERCNPHESQTAWTRIEGCGIPLHDWERMVSGAARLADVVTILPLVLALLAIS